MTIEELAKRLRAADIRIGYGLHVMGILSQLHLGLDELEEYAADPLAWELRYWDISREAYDVYAAWDGRCRAKNRRGRPCRNAPLFSCGGSDHPRYTIMAFKPGVSDYCRVHQATAIQEGK